MHVHVPISALAPTNQLVLVVSDRDLNQLVLVVSDRDLDRPMPIA